MDMGPLASIMYYLGMYFSIIEECRVYCVPYDGMGEDGWYVIHLQIEVSDGGVEDIDAGIIINPETGLVRGNVSVKIVGRQQNDETMIFQQDIFDCLQVFGKKNTLSDLITAYVRRYRLNNSSELAELSLTQFINTSLYEVTDKISICGNKKKQTIITIPSGYETEVDGMVLSKDKTMKFSSMEKVIELRFNNRGCSYTINLIFTRM